MMLKRVQPARRPIHRIGTPTSPASYGRFDLIDGHHPIQETVPESTVMYPVRILRNAEVVYFNFDLAIEMGLIPKNHPRKMNAALHKKLVETFSLRIVNEFDQKQNLKISKADLKPNKYMATRYLQLQHSNKRGRTSGDGRSIWNGQIESNGKLWDVSSRGTGVTCLAPGAVEANRPLKTGAGTFGYGCGLADLDEVYGSAVFSEIFHHNKIGTERVLVILDLGRNLGIGVRVAPSLVRPAHLFLHLKQGNRESLKRMTDLFISSQVKNEIWSDFSRNPSKYSIMVHKIAEAMAQFAAKLERNYVFAWLDWDGDNVLANAGIIDYGSIRQFGLRHDQYRYDDVTRFSTNLNEQRFKARQMVRVFAQLSHFLETGKKRSLGNFRNHKFCKHFDKTFRDGLRLEFLEQVGFANPKYILANFPGQTERLYKDFLVLEKAKTKKRRFKVADGVHRPAILNMRAFLRDYPRFWLENVLQLAPLNFVPPETIHKSIETQQGSVRDQKLTSDLKMRLRRLEKSYRKLVLASSKNMDLRTTLRDLRERSELTNRAGRITGNGSELIVSKIMQSLKKGVPAGEIQKAVELFIASQTPRNSKQKVEPISIDSTSGKLYQLFIASVLEAEEDI